MSISNELSNKKRYKREKMIQTNKDLIMANVSSLSLAAVLVALKMNIMIEIKRK